MDALTVVLIGVVAVAVIGFAFLAWREVAGKKAPPSDSTSDRSSPAVAEAPVRQERAPAQKAAPTAAVEEPVAEAAHAYVPEPVEAASVPLEETPEPVAVSTGELALFAARLSIMPADFDRAAAVAVAGGVAGAVDALLAAGLIVEAGEDGRFLLAEQAPRNLDAAERRAARMRHAQHFIDVGRRAQEAADAETAEVSASFDAFETDKAHFEAAFDFLSGTQGCERELVDLVAIVSRTNGLHHTPPEAIAWIEPALTAARALGDQLVERDLLQHMASARTEGGEENAAIECLEEAADISRKLGDRLEEGRCLGNIGLAYQRLKQPRQAVAYLERVAFIMRELGDRAREGVAMSGLGQVALDSGDTKGAIGYFEKHLEIAVELGDKRAEVVVLSHLGNAYQTLGDLDSAIGYFERQLRISNMARDLMLEGNALGNLGRAQRQAKRPERAVEYFTRQVEVAHLLGNAAAGVRGIGDLGMSHLEAGFASRALDCFDEQLKLARKLGDRDAEAHALWNAARVVHSRGQIADAVTRASAAVPILDELGSADAAKLRAEIDEWRSQGG